MKIAAFVAMCLIAGVGGCSAPRPSPNQAKAREAAYANAQACANCHPAQGKTYQNTGMGRAFAAASAQNVQLGSYYHRASDRYYEIVRRGDRFFQRRHQKLAPGGQEQNVFEAEIHYAMGSGNHSRTYLHRTPDNRLLQLPVSWYAEKGGTLAMSPGYDTPAHQDFRREVSYTCFFCHNGYPRSEADGGVVQSAEAVYPPQLPEGIDCQRCHGPGQAHLDAVKQGRAAAEVKAAIVNPKKLSREREMEVCLQCHLETTSFELPGALIRHGRGVFSYRPGEPLSAYQLHFDHAPGAGYDDKFEIAGAAYRLRKSACFTKSAAGAMRCTTCHNPHDIPRGEQAASHYRSACLTCHAATLRAQHAAEKNCAGCHMPKRRTEDVVHVAMTDHRITRRAPPAAVLLAARAERHTAPGDKPYRGEVVLYDPAPVDAAVSPAERELYLAVAQVGQQSNLQAGIARLEEAVRRHKPAQAEFYLDLALAYGAAGAEQAKAIGAYRDALAKNPKSLPGLRGLGAALVRSGESQKGAEALERARALDPRDAPTLHELARAYRQLGRAGEARSALEAAVAANPNLTGAWDALGNMQWEAGHLDQAERSLREAIRRQPEFASAHANLANVLMAKQSYEEAERMYQRAIALDPAHAIARYNYGGALAGAGRFGEAEAQLEAAAKAQPTFGEANAMLGDLLARRRAFRPAIERYQAALAANAQLGRARLGLGIALAASGDPVSARPHLEQVARHEGEDPQLRQAAAEALRSLDTGRPR